MIKLKKLGRDIKNSDLNFIEIYKDLIKKYKTLTQELIEILKQSKTDCHEQSVEKLTKQLNSYREYQNLQKANCDTVQED